MCFNVKYVFFFNCAIGSIDADFYKYEELIIHFSIHSLPPACPAKAYMIGSAIGVINAETAISQVR